MKTALPPFAFALSILAFACGETPPASGETQDANLTKAAADDESTGDREKKAKGADAPAPPASSPDTPTNADQTYFACLEQCADGDPKATAIVASFRECDSLCPAAKGDEPSSACLACFDRQLQIVTTACGSSKTSSDCPKFDECDQRCNSPGNLPEGGGESK